MADWSLQPCITFRDSELHNVGQYFSIKWKLPFSDKLHLFYYFGTNGMGGLSYKYEDGTSLSFGVGFAASNLFIVDEKTNKKSLNLDINAGIFFDRNNSLLASLVYTRSSDYRLNLNVYPGVFKFGSFSPGFFAACNPKGKLIFGISAIWMPFGLAHLMK